MRSKFYMHGTPEERFWAKVEVTDGCWLWLAGRQKKGYGTFSIATSKSMLAHHFLVGQPPPGFEWDHICHNADPLCPGDATCVHRRCVRPDHLELVTADENKRRKKNLRAFCTHGHMLTPDNIYWQQDGGVLRRRCRTCNLEAVARYKARKNRS